MHLSIRDFNTNMLSVVLKPFLKPHLSFGFDAFILSPKSLQTS